MAETQDRQGETATMTTPTTRSYEERERDRLEVGEVVRVLVHGVHVDTGTVERVGSDFSYTSGLVAPLGYYVRVPGHVDEPEFFSRPSLFRGSELHELVDRLQQQRDCIDCYLDEIRREQEAQPAEPVQA